MWIITTNRLELGIGLSGLSGFKVRRTRFNYIGWLLEGFRINHCGPKPPRLSLLYGCYIEVLIQNLSDSRNPNLA